MFVLMYRSRPDNILPVICAISKKLVENYRDEILKKTLAEKPLAPRDQIALEAQYYIVEVKEIIYG